MQADLLRKKFLDFFKSKKHKIIESDSLVPRDDPTVLFTPAGMNQFKKEFLGFASGFSRAATAQRCLRTDDLDKVGRTPCHHTFFEMLGNFSFGDYFKKDAILWAWEFLTQELKIQKDKLWVSVYQDDTEAYSIWKDQMKITEEKIIKLGDKENFWPSEAKTKGPNGPCGPCSEIFFDFGKESGCGKPDCSPGCACGRFSEIWNLVFTQFNRKEGGVLEPLPQKNIDTGMGLERLTAVMQGVKNNFETDLFKPIIKEIADNAPRSPNFKSPDIYAVADHIRPIIFAIYDGVLPANENRGYVIRKIIRKSALHLRALGIEKPFLYKLVPVLSQIMKGSYPELDSRREDIAQVILSEEKNFISTLGSSPALFKDNFERFSNKPDPEEVGRIAFYLYDTYGMPLELTQDWLDKHAIRISQDAFHKELEEQKMRSKSHSAMKGDVFDIEKLHLASKVTKFIGYRKFSASAKIVRIIQDSGQVKRITQGQEARIILDRTPFYPESGGQIADTGELNKGKNKLEVLDTQVSGKVIIHIGKVKEGSFKKNDVVQVKIDARRRLSISKNHTATHLLQAALRKVLGNHVKQQGSLVADDRLRFDFTHFKDISEDEISRIEEVVNGYITGSYKLNVKQVSLSGAKKSGALAFFGEKYARKVRVVSIGDFSKELCGGAHLENTGQIGLFKIIQEGSVASGIRRIEAITAEAAYKKVKEEEAVIGEVAALLNTPPERIVLELQKRMTQLKSLERQLMSHKLNLARDSVEILIQRAKNLENIKFISETIENTDIDLLRKTVDLIKRKSDNAVIALASKSEKQAFLIIGVTADLVNKGWDAANLIRDIAKFIGGSGGGRKDFAQAGGNRPEGLDEAFKELENILNK